MPIATPAVMSPVNAKVGALPPGGLSLAFPRQRVWYRRAGRGLDHATAWDKRDAFRREVPGDDALTVIEDKPFLLRAIQ